MHGHANDSFSEEYKALYHYYESQYITPVLEEPVKPVTVPDSNDSKKTVIKSSKADSIKKKTLKSEANKKDTKNHKKASDKHKK